MADRIVIQTKPKTVTKIIVIRETMTEGIVNDVSMAAVWLVLIGVGVYVGSTPMQWAGFFLAVLWSLAFAKDKADRGMTVEQARSRLDEIEAEIARPSTQTEQERP